jgi:O-antigen ligase
MILRIPRNFLFPLTTLAFVAIPVEYANIVFTTTTRWIFLVILTIYLLFKGRFLAGFQSLFGMALLIYCAWCITTYSWSDVPQLSIEKAVAFSLVAVAFVCAGQDWVRERGSLKAIACLTPVAATALFAGVIGRVGGGVPTKQQGMELYQGLTNNPNMLGSLIVMALPVLFWTAYKYRTKPQIRWLWFALLALAVILLARTYSRAAILSAGMLGIGFCLSLRLSKTGFVLVLIAAALLFVGAVSSAVLDTTYKDYILKGGSQEQGIFFSRGEVWRISYENAQQGGWFGAGYGVTVGETDFQGGATAVGYGREKGNTQLAIVEETGIVGLGLYFILLLALFVPLVRAHLREKNTDIKVVLGIVIGALAGLTVMSIFEAWWVAPGSAESAYFWSLAGVGFGLTRSWAFAPKTSNPPPMAQEAIFHPASLAPQRRVKG